MELLLREHPDRYAYHEAQEQGLRDHLGKDVSILRDRSGGTVTPLTLRRFRERIQIQPELFDDLDWGGCGCFIDDAQEVDRMTRHHLHNDTDVAAAIAQNPPDLDGWEFESARHDPQRRNRVRHLRGRRRGRRNLRPARRRRRPRRTARATRTA